MTAEELKATFHAIGRAKAAPGLSPQDKVDLWAAQIVIERLARGILFPPKR